MKENNIYVIIVSYNFTKNNWLKKNIESLYNSSIPLKIIVVDNNSNDDTVEIIKKNYPEIILFEQKANLGFALANNIAIDYAYKNEATHIFLLNQDAWVEKDTIKNLVECTKKNPKFGVISPMHLNGLNSNFDEGFATYLCNNVSNKLLEDLYMNRKVIYPVDFVNAAAWLITRDCIEKVGGFDTNLFRHYGEDYNYSQRMIYHKIPMGVYTGSTICHDRQGRFDKPLDETILLCQKYGNINKDFLVLTHPMLFLMQKLIKSFFQFKIKNFIYYLKEYKKIKKLIPQIIFSRKINSQIGCNWLIDNN